MQKLFAAAVAAAVILAMVSVSLAGTAQLEQRPAESMWRCTIDSSTSAPHAMSTYFRFDESTLVKLLITGAPFESMATNVPFDEQAGLEDSAGRVALCWVTNGFAGARAFNGGVQTWMVTHRAREVATAREPVTLAMQSFGSTFAQPVTLDVLSWGDGGWQPTDALPVEEHLPLSLDYSTVSLPNPLLMGAIGLLLLGMTYLRRIARAHRPA